VLVVLLSRVMLGGKIGMVAMDHHLKIGRRCDKALIIYKPTLARWLNCDVLHAVGKSLNVAYESCT